MVDKMLRFLLGLCCFFTIAISKSVIVNPAASADNITVFLTLYDSVLSLINSSGKLIDDLNTITLNDSTINQSQYFPNVTITGDSSSGINIIYPNATSIVNQSAICANLPQLVLANQSFLSLTSFGYFSITGLSIRFGTVEGFNSITKLGNFTISQYCFDSTSQTGSTTSSFNSFGLSSITSISFLNGVYVYDQTKTININSAQSVVVDSILLAIPTYTKDLYQFGFYIDDTGTTNASVTFSNVGFACNAIFMVTPALVVAKSSAFTTFSSVTITECDFSLSGSQFYGAVLSAVLSTTFVVENLYAQDLSFGPVFDNMFIYTMNIANAYLTNFYATGITIQGSAGTANQFLYISSPINQPMNLIADNWTIINTTISNSNSFFLIVETSVDQGSSFQLSKFEFSECTVDTASTLITFAVTASTDNSVVQTRSKVSLNEFQVIQSTGSSVYFFDFAISGLEFIPAVEVYQVQVTNWTLSDNSMNQAAVFLMEGLLLQVQNLSAENITLSASSLFSSQNLLSSLFLANSSFDTLNLAAASSIVSYSMSSQRMQTIENSFDNSGVTVYAETRPFIMASCSFNNIQSTSGSVPFIAKNPMIAIQENNFTNCTGVEAFLQLGGYINMITAQTTFLTSNDSINSNTYFSTFDLVEGIMFQNLTEMQALFSSSRDAVTDYDSENSVYFIVLQNSYFNNITVSSGQSLISINNFEINNGTILTGSTTIEAFSLLSTSTFYFFQGTTVTRFIFGAFSMANVSLAAYVFALSSDVIENLLIDQNSFTNNTQLTSFLIEGTSCTQITIQNMVAYNLVLDAVFMSITCMSINGQITISGFDFQNISESVVSTIFNPVNFISFSVDTASSNNQGLIFFNDSLFQGISFSRQDGYAKGVFASTIFSLLTLGCTISFQNVTFDTIEIIPSGSILMISAPTVLITNSSFADLTYWNTGGAIELVLQSMTLTGTIFQQNIGLNQAGAGLIHLSDADTESTGLVIEIDNCTFSDNEAPYGTILSLESAGVNFSLTNSLFIGNQLTGGEGLLLFSNLSNSQIALDGNQFNVDQDYWLDAPNFIIISIQAGVDITTIINNTILAVTGDIPGVLLSLTQNQDINVTLQALQYIIPNSSSSTSQTPYFSAFGVLFADNVQGVVSNMSVLNAIINGETPLFQIDCVFGDLMPRVWELDIIDSTFSQLELGRSLIVIESSTTSAAPLNNLSITVENCTFSDIMWSGTDAGIVKSSTSFIGKYQTEQSYAVNIANCDFFNLSSTSVGSIFSGYEPIFGSSLLLLQANNFDLIDTKDSGGIVRIDASTQNIPLDARVVNLTQDTSPNTTILCSNNTFTRISAVSGGVIYAIINQLDNNTSQTSSNGVSIMLADNTITDIAVTEKGGVIYMSSIETTSNTSAGSASRRVLPSQNFSASITVLDSTVSNLQAQDGGFLYENTQNRSLSLTMQDVTIQNSTASSRGGVFYLQEPSIFITSNTFSDCEADISGNILFSVSGQLNLSDFNSTNLILNPVNTTSSFSFAPTNLKIDFLSLIDNSLLQLENYANISSNPIVPNLTSYSLSQYQIDFTLAYAGKQGYEVVPDETSKAASLVVEFTSINEGKTQTHYSKNCSNSICSIVASEIALSGDAGDLILVNATYTSNIFTQFQQFQIRLRSCLPGEINHTDIFQCVACTPGTYSVNLSDTECHECPTGAICNGGSNITIQEGFYRSALTDDLYVIDCNDSGTRCAGGYNSSCTDSFQGPLCLQCKVEDNYFPAGSNECSQCAGINRLIVLGTFLLIGAISYQIVMVIVTFKENKKAHKEYELEGGKRRLEPGALLVIFSTFSQISSIIANFDVGTVTYLLNISVSIGNPNDQAVFSLKCLYFMHIPDPTGALIFQMLFYVFSPFLKILALLVIMLIWNACKGARSRHTKRDLFIRIGAFATAIILLEQPGIIGILCQYLNCTQLDPNIDNYYITQYNNVQCYTHSYNYFLKIIVIPGLLFWGIVIPLGIFIIMSRKRKILFKTESIRLVLGNLYNNYIEKAYYWGILVMIMKIIIFIIDSLISSQSFKGLIYMCIFHGYYVLLKKKQPGNHKSLNVAENYCCIAYMGILTLVFFKIASDNSTIDLLCNLGILFIVLYAGGYILLNIFWIQVNKVILIYHKLRIRLMGRKVLSETLGRLREYHMSQDSLKPREQPKSLRPEGNNIGKRRNAICLDLPARLRQTEKHELELVKAKHSKRIELINLKKQQLYDKVRNSFTFTKGERPSAIIFEVPKAISSDSITLEFKNVHQERRAETDSICSQSEFGNSVIQLDSPMNQQNPESFEERKVSISTPKHSIFRKNR